MLKITADANSGTCKTVTDGSLRTILSEFAMAAMAVHQSLQRQDPKLGQAVTQWLTGDMHGSFRCLMQAALIEGKIPTRSVIIDADAIRKAKENG